ncbi:MAG: N-acetyltransferase [Burkholderiales bacterium]|nr:N-acetyltransferase [Burkholderiales bacterium]
MSEDYVIGVADSPLEVNAAAWDALLQSQPNPSPFMRHAYLAALHASGSATARTGWRPHFFTLHRSGELVAACAIYEKAHSYGEYVFDWAWVNAYAEHGLPYYPKAVAAVPFTPVPGARLMARTVEARIALLQALLRWCEQSGMSSLHLLFVDEAEAAACEQAGLMLRHGVQFHWQNTHPGYTSFDAFLQSLSQEKRKKIRQERRKVADAGVTFRWSLGRDISRAAWDFFYRCYERTYLEHGNAPYLNRDFFQRMADTMPEHWLLFTAERGGRPIATSLIALDEQSTRANSHNATEDWAPVCFAQVKEEPAKRAGDTEQNTLAHSRAATSTGAKVAYGRYWGALERVDCLHFEACYYQPLQWCIDHGYQRFEGGAQGEHKMARALLPVKTTSAHWLAHPAFADAVARFLAREGEGINNYLEELEHRNPFRQGTVER